MASFPPHTTYRTSLHCIGLTTTPIFAFLLSVYLSPLLAHVLCAYTRLCSQVKLLVQKGNLRAGCRFALRVAETNEDVAALEADRAENGVEWTKFEALPCEELIDVDRDAFPGLKQAEGVCGGGADAGNGARCLPAVGAVGGEGVLMANGVIGVSPDEEAGEGKGKWDVSLDNLYVALQGWVGHSVDDADVRFRPKFEAALGGEWAAAVELAEQVNMYRMF